MHKVVTAYFPFLADRAEAFGDNARKNGLLSADTALKFCHGNFGIGVRLFAVDMLSFGKGNSAHDNGGGADTFTQADGIADF